MGAVYRARDRHDRRPGRAQGPPRARRRPRRRALRARGRRCSPSSATPRIVRYVAHGTTDARRALPRDGVARGRGPLASASRAGGSPPSERVALVRARRRGARRRARARHRPPRHQADATCSSSAATLDAVKLLDFGIARRPRGAATRSRAPASLIGTPGYMAPEQARGERDVDARADVFSLGCVLFECLDRRSPPFARRHADGGARQDPARGGAAARALRARRAAPRSTTLVARMLAKDAGGAPARRGARSRPSSPRSARSTRARAGAAAAARDARARRAGEQRAASASCSRSAASPARADARRPRRVARSSLDGAPAQPTVDGAAGARRRRSPRTAGALEVARRRLARGHAARRRARRPIRPRARRAARSRCARSARRADGARDGPRRRRRARAGRRGDRSRRARCSARRRSAGVPTGPRSRSASTRSPPGCSTRASTIGGDDARPRARAASATIDRRRRARCSASRRPCVGRERELAMLDGDLRRVRRASRWRARRS